MNNKLLLERKAELWILAEKKLQIIPSSEKGKLQNNQITACTSQQIFSFIFSIFISLYLYIHDICIFYLHRKTLNLYIRIS